MKPIKKSRRNKHKNIFSNNVNKKQEIKLEANNYFPSTIYSADIPEFLGIVTKVSDDFLSNNPDKINEIYPVRMTPNFSNDPRLVEFSTVILDLGWDILKQQGYDMNSYRVIFTAMWTQQHHKYSLMEQHMHKGDQLVGFYFLKTPENCSRPLFYDPRPAKVITDLPEENDSNLTNATSIVNYFPTPGNLIITNSYIPHSFTKNASIKPTEFIHFNMTVIPYVKETCDVEIV
jgi:hypothetical protein